MSDFDHGMLNLPLSHRARGKSIEKTIDSALAQIAAEKKASAREANQRRRAARETEAARVKLTQADVQGVTHVRDEHGWHKVVRVSAKSVTVETGYSWTDRIPLARVLETHTSTPSTTDTTTNEGHDHE